MPTNKQSSFHLVFLSNIHYVCGGISIMSMVWISPQVQESAAFPLIFSAEGDQNTEKQVQEQLHKMETLRLR